MSYRFHWEVSASLQGLENPAEAHLLTSHDVALLFKEVHQAAYRVGLAHFDPITPDPTALDAYRGCN